MKAALPPPKIKPFAKVLAEAIADLKRFGYSDSQRVFRWVVLLRRALGNSMPPLREMEHLLRLRLTTEFDRLVLRKALLRMHPGVSRFTLDRVEPQLRQELDRRIVAAADLIKLNRDEAIEKTLRRFSGWSTSIPVGGTAASTAEPKIDATRPLQSLGFIERRVLIDQAHKLRANLSQIVAKESGAVAAVWHSHWRQAGYDYREDHKERDEHVYLIRGSWAHGRGLVKPGNDGYLDGITQPGEEVFCRCRCVYLTAISALPEDMITAKGHSELERVRAHVG